jgi:hypothetical protein
MVHPYKHLLVYARQLLEAILIHRQQALTWHKQGPTLPHYLVCFW